MITSGTGIVMALKGAGAAAGSIMSFALVPPKSIREGVSRVVVSFPSGYIFADAVRELLRLAATIENIIAGGTLAGLLSWVVFGAVIRLAQTISWGNIPWPFKKK